MALLCKRLSVIHLTTLLQSGSPPIRHPCHATTSIPENRDVVLPLRIMHEFRIHTVVRFLHEEPLLPPHVARMPSWEETRSIAAGGLLN